MLSEFVPLPTRLASSPLNCALSTFGGVSMHSHYCSPLPPAAAAELTHNDNTVLTRKHYTTYYNSWKSSHTASHAREMEINVVGDAAGLEFMEGVESLSDCDGNDDATEDDSSLILSSLSYEHLDTRRADTVHGDDERLISTSPALNDCQSLVSVTPDTDSLSTTSTSSSSVPNVEEDSLSDAPSLYDNADVWSQKRTRRRDKRNDFVVRQRRRCKGIVSGQDLNDGNQEQVAGYRTFDGKEIATIRMLELELLTADLSRQMLSMHKLMRLLSCETSQLARLIDDRRRSVRTVLPPAQRRRDGSGLVENLSSDNEDCVNEAKMALAGDEEAVDSTQKALMSTVLEELKSVSLVMSRTLQSLSANRSPTAHGSGVRNNDDNNNNNNNKTELPTAALNDVYQLRTADRHLVCLSAATTDDDNDDDYDDDDDINNETCTTEVSAWYTGECLRLMARCIQTF